MNLISFSAVLNKHDSILQSAWQAFEKILKFYILLILIQIGLHIHNSHAFSLFIQQTAATKIVISVKKTRNQILIHVFLLSIKLSCIYISQRKKYLRDYHILFFNINHGYEF
jgi:hypothetical protein